MRRLLLIVMMAAFAGPALAQPASIETELVKGRCRFIEDDGEVGHYALKRCPGLGGAQVYTEAQMRTVALQFRWGKKGAYRTGVKSDSIGLKLEWRGSGTKAAFKPHAAIVTAVIKEFDKEYNETRHNVLAVIRIADSNACLMAVIDEPGNKDALVLARATADATAAGFSCAKDKPRVVGKPSHWAQRVIDYPAGDPD